MFPRVGAGVCKKLRAGRLTVRFQAKIGVSDDSAAITLMSTDIERIRQGMLMMHGFWAGIVEVAIASFLLYRSLGVAFVAPIAIVGACVLLAAILARFTSNCQRQWMDKIQERVGMVCVPTVSLPSTLLEPMATADKGKLIDCKCHCRYEEFEDIRPVVAYRVDGTESSCRGAQSRRSISDGPHILHRYSFRSLLSIACPCKSTFPPPRNIEALYRFSGAENLKARDLRSASLMLLDPKAY